MERFDPFLLPRLYPFAEFQSEPYHKGCSPPLHKNSDFIRGQHRLSLLDYQNPFLRSLPDKFYATSTHQIDTSKTALKDLTKITLQDLHMEEATKGAYLILRTIEVALRVVSIMTIVEDHEGNAVLFSVYNYSLDTMSGLVDDILPVGTIFILKEPYIKISHSGELMLRCDSPTDIIILHEGHKLYTLAEEINWKHVPYPNTINPILTCPKPKTSMEWKLRGNAFFKKGKFKYAIRCYLLAMQQEVKNANNNIEDWITLTLNLSAAYLQQGYFEKAWKFARKVLGYQPANLKALLRAGRSSYKLRQYKSALQYYELLHKLYPDNVEGNKEYSESKNRVLEQETGEFNMYKMHLERAFKPGQKIDCADYVGPVKAVQIAGKGRGVVTTTDVEPGTLLVVSKAMAFTWDDNDVIRIQANADQTVDFGDDIKLIAEISQAIAKNPNTFGKIVYDLFDGQAKLNSSCERIFCDPETKEEPIVDIQRIRKILSLNSFKSPDDQDVKGNKYPGGSGLFSFPSYFNHSCLPNANWVLFKDVMFIRSAQFIKVGEEVSISYLPINPFLHERNIIFSKFGFTCQCKLCIAQTVEGLFCTRQTLLLNLEGRLMDHMESGHTPITNAHIRLFKKLVKNIEMTYHHPPNEYQILKVSLLLAYDLMAKCHALRQKNEKEQIGYYIKIINEYGINCEQLLKSTDNTKLLHVIKMASVNQDVLQHIESIIHCYHVLGSNENTSKWIKILVALEQTYFGGDLNVAKIKYWKIKSLL